MATVSSSSCIVYVLLCSYVIYEIRLYKTIYNKYCSYSYYIYMYKCIYVCIYLGLYNKRVLE